MAAERCWATVATANSAAAINASTAANPDTIPIVL
jgi:hypothetical protein